MTFCMQFLMMFKFNIVCVRKSLFMDWGMVNLSNSIREIGIPIRELREPICCPSKHAWQRWINVETMLDMTLIQHWNWVRYELISDVTI